MPLAFLTRAPHCCGPASAWTASGASVLLGSVPDPELGFSRCLASLTQPAPGTSHEAPREGTAELGKVPGP